MPQYLKFYDNEKTTGKRKLFTFYVNNELDARKLLDKFNVKSGYYVVKKNGVEILNKKL